MKQNNNRPDDLSRLTEVLENIPCMVYSVPVATFRSQLILEPFSEWCHRLTGYSMESFFNQEASWLNMIYLEDQNRFWNEQKDLFSGPCKMEQKYRIVHKSGKVKWVQDIKQSIFDGDQFLGIKGFVFDISSQKLTEEEMILDQVQLRSMASDIQLVEEKERRKLAADLHDSIGQILTLTKIKLDQLDSLVDEGKESDFIHDLQSLVKSMIQQTRKLTFELSPPVLFEIGLQAALESLISKTKELYDLDVVISGDTLPKNISTPISLFLFRSVNELLINVLKHAKTKKASIRIKNFEHMVEISVTDEGEGFDVQEQLNVLEDSLGLFNLKERLFYIGGKLTIESAKNKGTRITLTAPLKNGNQT